MRALLASTDVNGYTYHQCVIISGIGMLDCEVIISGIVRGKSAGLCGDHHRDCEVIIIGIMA